MYRMCVTTACSIWAHRFDTNADGVLDEEEQKELVKAFGAEYGESFVAALANADKSHDGKIDAHELALLLAVETDSDSDLDDA
jgi:Ca2+-binding EF-hand superfamily protein